MRHKLARALGFGLLTMVLLGSAPPASAQPAPPPGQPAEQRATFGVRPATEKAPDDRASLSYGATPGATVRDFVAVSNVSEVPLTLKVYASDAFNTPEGGFDLLAAGRTSVDVGAWSKTARDSVTLAPRSVSIVPFTLTIPANATPGDHAAGIVAALTTEQTNADGQRVSVEQRVGARIYLRITGPLTPGLAITGLDGDYAAKPLGRGDATVSFTIRNTGNTRLSGTQWVRISTPWGSTVDSEPLAPIAELLPGGAMRVTTTVHSLLPAGWLTVTAHADPAAIPGFPDRKAEPAEATLTLSAVPWIVLGALAMLLLGILFVVLGRRRRKRTRAEPAKPEVAEHAAAH